MNFECIEGLSELEISNLYDNIIIDDYDNNIKISSCRCNYSSSAECDITRDACYDATSCTRSCQARGCTFKWCTVQYSTGLFCR